MLVRLNNIVQIQPGTHIKPSDQDEGKQVFFVGLRDFDSNFQYLKKSPKVNLEPAKKKYLVQENDLLFSTRLKFHAFLLPDAQSHKYVASNSFVIIKPDVSRILPKYLYWFLNHPSTQSVLNQLSQGQSRMPYISLKKLEKLEIDLPDIGTQKDISRLFALHQKEASITQKLIQKKEHYIQSLLLKTAKK